MEEKISPEKIYLQQYDDDTLISLNKYNIHEIWSEKPCNQKIANNIEYVKADTIIKKVCEWLRKHAEKYYNQEKCLGTEELTKDCELAMRMSI